MARPLVIGTCLAMAWLAAGCATQRGQTAGDTMGDNATPSQDCLRETGTRVKVPDGSCVELAGRSYSKDDLDRTGEINPLAALRHLDPTFR